MENHPTARFCAGCGVLQLVQCPVCHETIVQGSAFCTRCGARLQTGSLARGDGPTVSAPAPEGERSFGSRSALEGERKQVSVVFCDIVNSTGLAEELGPDLFHELITAFFEIGAAEMHRYGGRISQFLGDGFLALFGAPIAQEDHARHAALAALEFQRQLEDRWIPLGRERGVTLAWRMGLNSGLVVAGAIGDNVRADYTALGDTTNLAARLQQHAEPGQILIADPMARLLNEYCSLQPIGRVKLRGRREPVMIHRLVGLAPRRSPLERVPQHLLTPFVGREQELAWLHERLALAESGRGQVIGIVGEPGLGKTRLLREFRDGVKERRVTYREGRCLSYARATPFAPLLEMLRSNCKLADTDTPQRAAEKVSVALDDVGMAPAEWSPYLLHLLAIDLGTEALAGLGAEAIKTRTFEALEQMCVQGSLQRPLILVIEDLHWIDRTSEEFLTRLVPRLADIRVLLVCTYRVEYQPPWAQVEHVTELSLGPLTSENSLAVVDAAWRQADVPRHLVGSILGRAEGNPFFLEELTRSIQENRGKTDGEIVPETIQGVLMARLDRLPDEAKRLLQSASVIGREVPLRLLDAVHDEPISLNPQLSMLQDAGFIYEQRTPDGSTWVFKHALIQEVAYGSILQSRCQALHRRAGDTIAVLAAERLGALSSIVAEHMVRGRAWDPALNYLVLAGDAAVRQHALPEARLHYIRALQVLDSLNDTDEYRRHRIDTTIKLVRASIVSDDPEQNLRRLADVEPLAQALPDPHGTATGDLLRVARVQYWMGRAHFYRNEPREAIQYYRRVLAVGQQTGDQELMAIPASVLGQVMMLGQGQYGAGGNLLAQAVTALEHTRDWPEWVRAMNYLGLSLASRGQYEAGLTKAQQALERAHQIDDLTGIGLSYLFLAGIHYFGGYPEHHLAASQSALEVTEKSRDRLQEYIAYAHRAWARSCLGLHEEAAADVVRWKEAGQALGAQLILARFFASVEAEIAHRAGRIVEALSLAQAAAEAAQAGGDLYAEGLARRVWGQALASSESSRETEAELQLRAAVDAFERGEILVEVARTHLAWGLTLSRSGPLPSAQQHPAQEHLAKATQWFESWGLPRDLEETRQAISKLPETLAGQA
jgi:class 3 adenylate cyclase/tetratricopeptide (TPR) repeat protein